MGSILEDATINFRMGGGWDGTEPSFTGSAPGASFMARARELRTVDEVQKTDTKGAGDTRAKNRYHTGAGTLTMSGVVLADSGYAFKAMGAVSPIGKWIEITTVPNSLLTTPDVFSGVITRWESSGRMSDATIESIEVDLDADFVAE